MDNEEDMNDWNLNSSYIPINLQSIQLVWLDEHLITSNSPLNAKYYRNSIRQLNNSVQFFTNLLKCLNFMKKIKKEKLILIVSGLVADEILKKIHSYKPLVVVFIFSKQSNKYMNLLDKYKKIIGIYDNRDRLLESISITIDRIERQIIVITIFDSTNPNSFRNLSKEKATFFWYQLFFLVLQDLPYDMNEMEELSKICKAYYQNNQSELRNIEDFFDQYQSDEAIKWYTRNTFLYKVINKILRDDNINLIWLFRFFIIDLYNQLYIIKENLRETNILILYRGVKIPITQKKDYLNITGKLISMKGFLSTSSDLNVALNFAGQNNPSFNESYEIGILFEINADPTKNILFADITDHSNFPNEREVLFGPNSIFYVNSVEENPTYNYIKVKMTATDEFSRRLDEYFSLQEEDMRNYKPLIYYGRILFNKMGEIEQAKTYFEMLLKKLPSSYNDIPLIYCQMGDLYLSQKDYNTALDYYNKAISIYYDRSVTDFLGIIDCLLKIGNTYLEQGKAEQTIRFGERAMRIFEKITKRKPQPARKAMILQMIGKAYLFQGKILRQNGKIYPAIMEINKVDNYLLEAYKIFEAMQRLEMTNFISILGDVSNYYEKKGDYLSARQLLKKQLQLAQKYLSFDDPKQQIYLENFIRVYESHGCSEIARKIVRKKLKYFERRFGKTHPLIIKILMAMGFYVTVCHLLFDIEPLDEQTIAQCLDKLSHDKDSNIKSIGLCRKWLDYLVENYPTGDHRIADALRQMANIYNDIGEFAKAYLSLYYSLQIYKQHRDHLNMRTVEDFMRHIEQGSGRLHIANIVCNDNWENALLFLGERFNDTPILSIPLN